VNALMETHDITQVATVPMFFFTKLWPYSSGQTVAAR
jgi:hypothetical protein